MRRSAFALVLTSSLLFAGAASADWGWPSKGTTPTPTPAAAADDQIPSGRHVDDESDPHAVRLVRKLERAQGGRYAWQRTRHVAWSFFGERQFLWDKTTNNVRIETDSMTWLMNIDSKEGRVWKDGAELQGSELRTALSDGYDAWKNNGYWMFMPWKLFEEGVLLKSAGVGVAADARPADKVQITFRNPELAPEAKYIIWIDRKTRLVNRWSCFDSASDAEPKLTGPWKGWAWSMYARFSGDRGRAERMNPQSWNWIPRSAYESPAHWAMPGKVEELGSRRATGGH